MLDLQKGYTNFLVNLIKLYFSAEDLIQKEIAYYTKNDLQDSLVFFLICFGSIDREFFSKIKVNDVEKLKEYIELSDNFGKLTEKGKLLQKYLSEKISAQANILEFNGIKPEALAKNTTILSRFYRFWQSIFKISN